MDNQQERPLIIDLAWLAGMWEADGSFSLSKNANKGKHIQYEPLMQFVNTDIDIAKNVIDILVRIQVGYYQLSRIQTGLGTKLKHEIRIAGIKRCTTFLHYILPYLRGQKYKRALLIKQYLDYRLSIPKNTRYSDKEHQLYAEYENYNKSITESPETNMLDLERVKIEPKLY